jgi:chaperone BCS1
VAEYKKYLKNKSCDRQLLLTITYDEKEKDVMIEHNDWDSTVTFNNSHFQDKDNIMSKIDFFLNNKEWYMKKGIPYNLGILLYGEPGCGKTRFIKQLMNYTGRHGIDIKLNDGFDFTKLRDIIFDEEIEEEYIIPQDKRIIIFEDIDAIGDVIKSRDKKNTSESNSDDEIDEVEEVNETFVKNKKKKHLKNLLEQLNKSTSKDNNNLSFILNILDGLNECTGRIIIMTTNKIDHLDKALIRPGRIDIKINFTKSSKYDISQMISKFWEIDVNTDMIHDDIDMKFTSAEVINIFRTTDNFETIKDIFIKA